MNSALPITTASLPIPERPLPPRQVQRCTCTRLGNKHRPANATHGVLRRCNSPHDRTKLVSDVSQYFIGGTMPESASPMQQAQTIIEIRPYLGGWQCFEGPGVRSAVLAGENAKQRLPIMPERVRNLCMERFAG